MHPIQINSLQKCYMRSVALLLCVVLVSLLMMPAALAARSGVTTDKVVLRKSADKNATVLQSLPKGEDVDVLSTSGSWYRVRYGKYTGYIMKKYVSVNSSEDAASDGSKSEKIRALGNPPGAMRIGDDNSDVKKLQQALEILGYYDGRIDGDYGRGTTAAV